MTEPRLTPGGLATQYSSVGHYELTDEQAMIITVPASDAPYLGFQLGSLWYISLDYVNHQTSLNNGQAQVDPDGMVRMVVSEKNPGVTNWIETVGHPRGILQFRWQRVSRELTPQDGPTVEIVAVADIAKHLPHFRHQRHHRRGLGSTHCPAPGRHRQPNAGVIMTALLEDRVVVISGVGPGTRPRSGPSMCVGRRESCSRSTYAIATRRRCEGK